MEKPNHFATWSVAFATASLCVWLTFANYLWLGLRFRMPEWFLTHEKAFFTLELLALMVGCAITVYESGVFRPRPEDADAAR